MTDSAIFFEQINLMIQDIRGRVERERLELEKFLGTLMDRLSHIEGALEETDSSTREVFASKPEARCRNRGSDPRHGVVCTRRN